MYWVVQIFTFAVLILAANTSYQGFPRLSALLAGDGFIARQFTNLGDRLVYSNGVVVLAGAAALLVWIYHANVVNLIHLYVVGVFTAFTLSQAGMVRYWLRTHGPGWRWRAVVNGVGATATFVVMVIVVATKFTEGAWMVIVAIPLMIVGFYGIRRHYRRVARRLAAGAAAVVAAPPARNSTLLVVESLDEATDLALWFARTISGDDFRAVHVPLQKSDPGIRPRWFRRVDGNPQLEILDPQLGLGEAMLEQVWRLPRSESEFVTVVVPEKFRSESIWEQARHRGELALKFRLLSEPGVVVADVPAIAGRPTSLPERLVARVLVSGVNAASMRAVNYATTLGVRGHTRRQLRLQRGRRAPDPPRVVVRGAAAPARGRRGAVPRHRRPAARLPARPHRRGGDDRARAHAGADHARLAAAPAQPARPLHQASAPAGAERHPRQRPVPAAAMKISDIDPRELLRTARRRAKRIARRTAAVRYRSIVVPLLGREETEHAVDLACRLAADRRARVVLVAPLVVEPELPLNAQFLEETAALTGASSTRRPRSRSRTAWGRRSGSCAPASARSGYELAEVARDHRAELIVVGAPVESRRGFRRAFPPEILSVLREAPCRVMVATGPVAGRSASRAPAGAAV